MNEVRRPPAMSDVALRAGVSHQTVSRVLNDHPHVRPETRDRVLTAISELGYRRNSAARALVTRRTRTLGVVTTGSVHHGPASTLLGLERAARETGYYVSVASVQPGAGDTMNAVLGHFLEQGVDGVVIVAPQVQVAKVVADFASPVPVVLVTSGEEAGEDRSANTVAVGVDQRDGIRQLVHHLAELGHHRIVHLAGPQDWFDARDRWEGWQQTCIELGIPITEPVWVDWSARSGYRAAVELIDRGLLGRSSDANPEEFSAVLAANDQLALGVLRACAERGLRVPLDVSVTGFDDEAGAECFWPPLTTVRQDFDALGRAAIDALMAALSGNSPRRTVLPANLVIRDSSGPAPR